MYRIELLRHYRFSRVKQMIFHKMNSLEKTKDERYPTVLIDNKLHQTSICTSAHPLRCMKYAIIVWKLPRSGKQRQLIFFLLSMHGRIQDFLFYDIECSVFLVARRSNNGTKCIITVPYVYTEHRYRHIAMPNKLLSGKQIFIFGDWQLRN